MEFVIFIYVMILSESVSYRALYDVLAPLAHVGTVLNRRTALLFPVPAAVRIPGSQTIPTITKSLINDKVLINTTIKSVPSAHQNFLMTKQKKERRDWAAIEFYRMLQSLITEE